MMTHFLPEIRKTPLGSHMSTAGWSTIECTLVKGFHAVKNELASVSINLRWSNMTTIWKSKALKNNTLEFLIITPDWNTVFSGQTSQLSLFFAGSPRWLVDVWNHQDIRTAHPFLCGQGVPMTRALLRRLEGPSFVNACQELLNTWGILDATWHNYCISIGGWKFFRFIVAALVTVSNISNLPESLSLWYNFDISIHCMFILSTVQSETFPDVLWWGIVILEVVLTKGNSLRMGPLYH